jgi:very-short-patch-repair endonuclease
MQKELLENLVKQNKSTYQIAREMNCSQTNIKYWLKKFNIKTKKIKQKRKTKYDYSTIQKDHDIGMTWRDLWEKYGISMGTLTKAIERGDFKSRNHSDAARIAKRPPMSEQAKINISLARRKFLKDNPHMVPYKLNHYSKGDSYPEKYFTECLMGSSYIKKYQVGLYELDFADIENKIDLEIDGCQHRLDPKIVEHDKKRNQNLIDLGWRIIRINWANFQKLNQEEKKIIVNSLITKHLLESSVVNLFGF